MGANSLVFVVIFISANLYFALKMKVLLQLASGTKGVTWGGSRLDRIPDRIATFLLNVLGQNAVLRKKAIGMAHASIFWGFLIITIETIENFAREIYAPFSFEFLGATIYSSLIFLQDVFTGFVLLGVLYAFYRRLIVKPAGLGKSNDAVFVLILTGSLMLSLLVMRSFHILATPQWYDGYMPISNALANMLEAFALSPSTSATVSFIFRWVHHLLVLGFLVYIPSSKHLHILAAGPNTFLRHLDPTKGMNKINLEDENATSFGVNKVTDLSWKDALDLYACTECGRCQDACPAWNTQKPLSPKALIMDLKDQLYKDKAAILSGKTDSVGPILGTKITDDVIWSCTSCRACEIECPVFIEQTNKIYDIRRNMVLMESRFPAELSTVFKNVENNFSPWAMSPEDRGKWAEDLNVKTMSQMTSSGETVDYLFWVGCAGSYDDRNKKVSRALVQILNKAGVKFAILGTEEKCTGDPVRRMGNEYLAQTLIQENVNTLNNYKVTKVVTACPHCFNAIKNEWKDFGGNFEVIHHTQLISELIRSGKIKPSQALNETVTYHDSCYIGRWNNEYDAPRNILGAVTNQANIKEMEKSKAKGMCCGAGGGRMWMEEHLGTRVNIARTEQALSTGAKVVAANCPFCMTMISDGIKAKEKVDEVKVLDLAEIVSSSLQ
ncbi:MAG: heterodisulfide reductase-related iron-sulfur binding cluster [Bacteriovoracia bacterium]